MSGLSLRNPLAPAVANQAPVPYVSRAGARGLGGLLGAAAVSPATQMDAFGAVGTLFSIVTRTSNATAQVDWKLWRKAKSGLKEDRVEITSHLALDIWNKPNPFMTRQENVEATQQHVDLTGEGYWVVAYDPRVATLPMELWPVRPDRMTPVPDPKTFLKEWEYSTPDGQKITLDVKNVIQLRMPNPMDPYRGLGPVQTILTDLDSYQAAATWNRNFFRNSALPGGLIQIDTQLVDDEYNEMVERWRESHQGLSNAWRVAILENGAKWVDRSYSMADMQFAELRSVSRDVIREAFGMPKFALGDVDDVNRATAEASKAWFAEMLTVPRLERIKGALNNDFLPLFGASARDLEFDYENPVPPDAEARNAELTTKAGAAATLVAAGFEAADVLDVVGLPQMGHTPRPVVGIPGQGLPGPGVVPETPENVLARARARLTRSPRRPRAAASDDEQEEARADWKDLLDELLADWEDITAAQREALREQIEEIVDGGDPEALATLTVPTDDAHAALLAAMVEQAKAAQQRMADMAAEAGEEVEPIDPEEDGGEELLAALAAAALLLVLLLASSLAAAAARLAWWYWGQGESGADVAAEVDAKLAGMSPAERRRYLGWALWQAEGEARWEILARMDWDHLEAVEEDDRSTCKPCGTIDGTQFPDIETARKAYPTGGYVHCLGELHCRGNVEPRWEARSARQASGT
ncbi:phage portal protein [Herbidospora daliensis]|uniref:phage portal protein n=1 Tax=Herbidospora daliensis TaxID=295585 RepID=UPI000780BCC9|nr:phage portal protein [Herbidospora daliensis]